MNKMTILILFLSILSIGCANVTPVIDIDSTPDMEPISEDPVFEGVYSDLVQFDENGTYDEAATEAALDLLFKTHPAVKGIEFDTPEGSLVVKSAYYIEDTRHNEPLYKMKPDGIDWDITDINIENFFKEYRSITRLEMNYATREKGSILDVIGEITPELLDSEYTYNYIGNYDDYVYKNTVETKPFDTLKYGEITTVNDPAISKYAFVYYIPENIANFEKVRILFYGDGPPHFDYNRLTGNIANSIKYRYMEFADKYGYVVFTVALPQIAQYFGRSVMIPGEMENAFWERPDLEIVKVTNALADSLEAEKLNIHRKIFTTGFSTGGLQAECLAIFHPEMVEATAPGAAGLFTYLEDEVFGLEVKYPMGFKDVELIEDWQFNSDAFKTVEHSLFAGSEDNKPINVIPFPVSDRELYNSKLGYFHNDRLLIYANYLNEYGVDRVETRIYEGYGHDYEFFMIEDSFKFFNSIPIN